MPLYRSMKNRENFAKPFGVINIAIVVVIVFYTTIGFLGKLFDSKNFIWFFLNTILGYLKYGDSVEGSITLSLPNEPLYDSVELMYSTAIVASHALQLYVAIHLLWPHIKNKLEESRTSNRMINISDYLFRAFIVSLTCK
jgi:proton-coupled amino acid transporter